MKKVLWLTERFPYPPIDGTKRLVFHYCRLLHDSLGLQVINASFAGRSDDLQFKPDFIERTYLLDGPSVKEKIKNLIVHTFIRGTYPMQVSLYWSEEPKRAVDKIIRDEKPDIVVADLVRTMEYLKDFDGLKLANMQDLFSKRYQQQMQIEMSKMNPYGSYLFRFPKALQRLLNTAFIKKCVIKSEYKRMRAYEKRIEQHYDSVFFVAKHEAELYNQMTGSDKALAIPMGVDVDDCTGYENFQRMPHSIAFVGAMDSAHNESGAVHFVNNILPCIVEKIPDARLYIIGGGGGDKIKALAGEHVELVGRLENVNDCLGKCEVFVCPLTFGSGIKNKNLEAMAMGIPVVTTSVGAENIDAVNGVDWLVADHPREFADRVVEILEDKELARKLAENGRKYVAGNFSWSTTAEGLRKIMRL